jgi:two-component system, sensor histidine kinase LadS
LFRRIFLIWCLACSLYHAAAIDISADRDHYLLSGDLERFEDPTRALGVEEVAAQGKFTPVAYDDVRLQDSNSAYWFRFTVRNTEQRAEQLLLHITPWQSREAALYIPNPHGGAFRSLVGRYTTPVRDSSQPRWQLAFEFALREDPAPVTYYLRVRPDAALSEVRLAIWRPSAFSYVTERDHLMFGVFFGAMFVMFTYNLFLFFSTRDTSYLYYVGYVGVMGISAFAVLGFARAYFPIPFDTNVYRHFIDVETAGLFSRILNLAALLLGLTTGIEAWRRGSRAARFFVLGWTLFLIGGVLNRLVYLQLLPANSFTLHIAFVGLFCEVTLFSFSLADRINRLREENARGQATLLQAQKTANQDLERQVQARTHELVAANTALEQLSVVDALTGLHNRRYFDQRFTAE